MVDLQPRSGSEQSGRRPCIVVSTDAFNLARNWRSITVVPLTSSERWQITSPTTVLFTAGESGLPKNCAALAHQITTIDRDKLIGGKIGSLSAPRLGELKDALENYLDLKGK
jgi:mRNA-degrading endonuclease toxin of MazEF toxin-antitoxin module